MNDLNNISTARRWWTQLDVHVHPDWNRDLRPPAERLWTYVSERSRKLSVMDIIMLCTIATTAAGVVREAVISWKVARDGIVALPQ